MAGFRTCKSPPDLKAQPTIGFSRIDFHPMPRLLTCLSNTRSRCRHRRGYDAKSHDSRRISDGLMALPAPSSASVVKFEVLSVESPAFEGRTFGAVGAYDRIIARATVAVAPTDRHNSLIADEPISATSASLRISAIFRSCCRERGAHASMRTLPADDTDQQFEPSGIDNSEAPFPVERMSTWPDVSRTES